MACVRVRGPWETFLDGELPADQTLELQDHLDQCSECAEEVALSRAVRSCARRVVLRDAGLVDAAAPRGAVGSDVASHAAINAPGSADVGLSEAFRARLSGALAREAQHEVAEARTANVRRVLRQWAPRAGALAVSSAAAVVLWVRTNDVVEPTTDVTGTAAQVAAVEPEEMLDRLLDYHSSPPEPQVTQPELVPQLERFVGVQLPLPVPSLAKYGAFWQGGSVVRVRGDRPAAYLRYRTVDDHKVTLYVFNPSRIPLHAGLEPRMYREQPVYEGYRRGYTIVAQLRKGVGYAVATDLDEPLSAELLQAITNGGVTR
jgi:anti-sigma factor RsiW